MKTRVWASRHKFDNGANVEEHQWADGSMHYHFRDRLGRPHMLDGFDMAAKIIRSFHMEEVTNG